MPWFDGSPLLRHLERLHVASDRNLVDVRFPVQYVIRPQSHQVRDYRGYAGSVASGVLKAGDPVLVLPSGLESTIASDRDGRWPGRRGLPADGRDDHPRGRHRHQPRRHALPAAQRPTVVAGHRRPDLLDGRDGAADRRQATRSSTRPAGREQSSATSSYRIDVNTLHRVEDATDLSLNEIGRIQLRVTQPLFVDPYLGNRQTGAFILVDEGSNRTVGAGMIVRT